MSKNLMGSLFALLATLLWSVNMVIASGVKGHIPPIGLAFWRWTVACVLLFPFAIQSTIKNYTIIKKSIWYLVLTALLGVTVFNTLIYVAGKTTTAVNLSLIAISIPLFIVFLSWVIFNEKISNKKLIGMAVIVTGVLVLITKGSLQTLVQTSFTKGDLLMISACFFFAAYTILVRRKPAELESKPFLFSIFVIGVVFLFPFYVWENYNVAKVIPDTKTILTIAYVGIFASLISYYLWNEAIALIGTSKTAIIYYLIPVFSGILAYLFLAQEIVFSQVASMGIIVSGLLLTNKD